MAGLRRMQFVKTSSLYMIERIRTVDKVEAHHPAFWCYVPELYVF